MLQRTECGTVRPLCKNKPVWRFEYKEDGLDDSLFIIEYCEDCYNLFKEIFPEEGWTRIEESR